MASDELKQAAQQVDIMIKQLEACAPALVRLRELVLAHHESQRNRVVEGGEANAWMTIQFALVAVEGARREVAKVTDALVRAGVTEGHQTPIDAWREIGQAERDLVVQDFLADGRAFDSYATKEEPDLYDAVAVKRIRDAWKAGAALLKYIGG